MKKKDEIKRTLDKEKTQGAILFGVFAIIIVLIMGGIFLAENDIRMMERLNDNKTEVLEYTIENTTLVGGYMFFMGVSLVAFLLCSVLASRPELFLCDECQEELRKK